MRGSRIKKRAAIPTVKVFVQKKQQDYNITIVWLSFVKYLFSSSFIKVVSHQHNSGWTMDNLLWLWVHIWTCIYKHIISVFTLLTILLKFQTLFFEPVLCIMCKKTNQLTTTSDCESKHTLAMGTWDGTNCRNQQQSRKLIAMQGVRLEYM